MLAFKLCLAFALLGFLLSSCNAPTVEVNPTITVQPLNQTEVNQTTSQHPGAVAPPTSLPQQDKQVQASSETRQETPTHIQPVIVSLKAFPAQEVVAGESLSFGVETNLSQGLSYVWSVTDGQLLEDIGPRVGWKAISANGSPLKVSRVIVNVQVKNERGQTAEASLNVLVLKNESGGNNI